MQGINKKTIIGYGLYDFANSAYVLIFNAYSFPIFFKEKVWGVENGDFIWGISLSISVILAMLISPIVGLYSDNRNRSTSLRVNVVISLIGMIFLALFPVINKLLYSAFFVITNAVFIVSLSLYDSILPHISNEKDRSTVSGFSWGVGYAGGIICLIFVLLVQKAFPDYERLSFVITFIFYGVFSLLALRLFPKKYIDTGDNELPLLKNISALKYSSILFVLLAVWLINEGIDTIIFFTSLFGRETLQMEIFSLGIFLMIVQLVAFPATWYTGILAKKIGMLRVINYSMIVWVLIILGTQLVSNTYHFAIISILTGLVIGSTQSLLRSYFSVLIPKEKSSFLFGFYTIFSRFATLVGPSVFGLLAGMFNQKVAMLSILLPLILGWYFLNKSSKTKVAV